MANGSFANERGTARCRDEFRSAFEGHIETCPACVRYLETYQQAVRMGKKVCSANDDALPEEVPEELVEAILAARRTN